MVNEELLKLLVCPKCKGDLEYREKEQKLICHKCRLAYPIVEDIPVMLVEEAEELDGND
ncbi:MAG: Trm112 family protein [Desulfurobacteriaceae bacterium]